MAPPPIRLFRAMLREAGKVNQYNFRHYAVRRVREDFRKNAALDGGAAVDAVASGEKALEMLRRQQVVGNLYPAALSVMEAESPAAFEEQR